MRHLQKLKNLDQMLGLKWRVKNRTFSNYVKPIQIPTTAFNQTQLITTKNPINTSILQNLKQLDYSLHFSQLKNFNQASNFYLNLIKQCKSSQEIKIIHTHMKNHGFPYLNLGNKLLNVYLKFGGLDYAHQLFDEMPQRKNVVVWNAMISCFIKEKRSVEALCLYKRMASEGVFQDDFTMSSVLKGFSDMGFVCGGRIAHGKAVVMGMEVSNVFVGSALVDMYAKFGLMRDAALVVGRVVDKDVVLFTALIVGYVQNGEDCEAMKAFSQMIKEGVKANEYTFTSLLVGCGNLEDLLLGKLLHCLILKYGHESGISSQTSLLTMYSKCGMVDDSLKIFETVSNPNLVTWTSLIVGLAQKGREESAISNFRQMMRSSVIPNCFTLSGVLVACSKLSLLDQGQQIHNIALKLGLYLDKFIGAALIDLYGRCGSVELARLIYDYFSNHDLVLVNTMMYAYVRNGFEHETLELFQRMNGVGLEPNEITLVTVLLAYGNLGRVDEGRQIFDTFVSNCSIRITKEHYACLVDIYGRAGRLEEAESLIKHISNPDIVLWRTLLSASRSHGDIATAERVLNKVTELSPRDEGSLVLSSNLYASKGNWSQFMGVKTLMREHRLKKSPVISWVIIGGDVHTFKAGDCSFTGFKEVDYFMEELMKKVKELGYVPATRFVIQDLDEKEKESSLYYHSEKLDIAFSLWKTSGRTNCIRIYKNLKVCGDCHDWIKLVTKVIGIEIVARDMKRFHSCKDYW